MKFIVAFAAAFVFSFAACQSCEQTNSTPSGTTADPVDQCERVADVCRYKGSQLGVCVDSAGDGTFVCAPQH